MTPNTPVLILVASLNIVLIGILTVHFELLNEHMTIQDQQMHEINSKLLAIADKQNLTKDIWLSGGFDGGNMQCENKSCKYTVYPHQFKKEQVCFDGFCNYVQFNFDFQNDTQRTEFELIQ